MDFLNLIQHLNLPKQYYNSNFVMKDKFKEESDKFLNEIQEYSGDEFGDEQKEEITNTFFEIHRFAKEIIDMIMKIYDLYDKSDFKEAQIVMDKMMDKLSEELFVGDIYDWIQLKSNERSCCTQFRLGREHRFYRIRAVDNEMEDITGNAYEMFHIPISKRAISSNERFSLNGFPCLYLATSLPIAWVECGCPTNYYYSEYEYNQNEDPTLKLLMLCSPSEIYSWGTSVKYSDFILWQNVVKRYLKTYPLILACSFVNHKSDVAFKQEYIISQMLMQWIRRNTNKIQGISYFTCSDNKILDNNWCGHDVVLPAIEDFDENGYSKFLKKYFDISNPVYYQIPVTSQEKSKKESCEINLLISDLLQFQQVYWLPQPYSSVIDRMKQICKILFGIIGNSKNKDMRLTLSILKLISEDINNTVISEINGKITSDLSEDIFLKSKSNIELEQIESDILSLYKRFKKLDKIVRNHIDLTWNAYPPHSSICVLYKKEEDRTSIINELRSRNLFYTIHKIDPTNDFVIYFRQLLEESKIPLNEFFGETFEDSNVWLRNNLDKIPETIYFKYSDVSIYSEPGLRSLEYIGEKLTSI